METEPIEDHNNPLYTGKRPPGLTLLCILTFIGSGISVISSIFIVLAYDLIPLAAEQSPVPNIEEMIQLVLTAGKEFFMVMGLLYALSLLGAIYMWKLSKKGFHIYTSAQLVMLIVPLLMIKGYQTPFTTVLLTASFILAYGLNSRIMR
ncbi:MAG: hypothetical protein RBS07_13475 [Lentimicrobium sp.]|jgi:hypothetical protein|nr:hypothetical protein [Lentimicrobium sp.]